MLLCLELAGHQGQCSVDPDDGVARHLASPFDAVIVDLDVSAGAYTAAIGEIRRRAPDLPIVATMWREIPAKVALAAGATATVLKPFDCSVILDLLAALIDPPR